MDTKKRLGPQDPLGWIRDTRVERDGGPEEEKRFPDAAPPEPLETETRREIVHTDNSIPMKVKVTFSGPGKPAKQTLTLEITVGR